MMNWKRIWGGGQDASPGSRSAEEADPTGTEADGAGDEHLLRAADSLRDLLEDSAIPAELRRELEAEYREVEALCAKLEHGHLHVGAFGRVSTGKSSLLNALVGAPRFRVSPLHGATRQSDIVPWTEGEADGVHLIDTPGIDELQGEERERSAYDAASRCDLVLFVTDGDLTDGEVRAMQRLAAEQRPLLLVLNKCDRYTREETSELLEALRRHAAGLVAPENVVAAAADPRPRRVIRIDAEGRESESEEPRSPDVTALKERIWNVLESEGKTLAALNAALFAGRLSDRVAQRITEVRHELTERIIRSYSLAKGVAVALNPIPVADLLAAASIDVALVSHLSRVYGLPMGRRESGRLLTTIIAQLAALMGAVWGVHLVSSALKTMSVGLSVTVTAGAQGALAYYATYLVGRTAQEYLRRGKSWGDRGPKRVVEQILASVDRNSILREARADILARLRRSDG